jgi:hypothetical protein
MRYVASWKKDKQGMGVTMTDPFAATEPVAAVALSELDCVTNKAKLHRTSVSVACATFKTNTRGISDAENRINPFEVKEGGFLLGGQQHPSGGMKMTALPSRDSCADRCTNNCHSSSADHRLEIVDMTRR